MKKTNFYIIITILIQIQCNSKNYFITGEIISANTLKPLYGVNIILINKNNNDVYEYFTSDSNGVFLIKLRNRKLIDSVILFISKDWYKDTSVLPTLKEYIKIGLHPFQIKYFDNVNYLITTQSPDEIQILNFHPPRGIDNYLLRKTGKYIVKKNYEYTTNALLSIDTIENALADFDELDSLVSLFNQGVYQGIYQGIIADQNALYIGNSKKTICCKNCILPEDTDSLNFSKIQKIVYKIETMYKNARKDFKNGGQQQPNNSSNF